jgi:hypothetical protein
MTSTFTSISSSYIKFIYRHSYLTTTDNFYYLFPTQETYHVLTLVNEVESTLATNDCLAYINIFLDDKNEKYYRTYSTIFDVMAQVSGF